MRVAILPRQQPGILFSFVSHNRGNIAVSPVGPSGDFPISNIWRAANLLIRQHGADAELEAVRLQDLMLDRGDDEGRRMLRRIRRATELLQAPQSDKAS
jgi:hypothetical protein